MENLTGGTPPVRYLLCVVPCKLYFSDDPSNLTLMAKYADYMSQYTETMEALENIDESELTASELSYYIGVMSRIQQMVLAVAG